MYSNKFLTNANKTFQHEYMRLLHRIIAPYTIYFNISHSAHNLVVNGAEMHTTEPEIGWSTPPSPHVANKRCLRIAYIGNLNISKNTLHIYSIHFQTICVTYKAKHVSIPSINVDWLSAVFIRDATHHRAVMLGGVCLYCYVVCRSVRWCRGSPVMVWNTNSESSTITFTIFTKSFALRIQMSNHVGQNFHAWDKLTSNGAALPAEKNVFMLSTPKFHFAVEIS